MIILSLALTLNLIVPLIIIMILRPKLLSILVLTFLQITTAIK